MTAYVREARIAWSAPSATAVTANTPASAADYLRQAMPLDDPREHFVAVALDTRHRVIGHHVVSIGTLDSSLVHPREVFRFLVLASAAGCVLAHNHPSGDPTPSAQDVDITRRLVDVGGLLGIAVVDHLILVDRGGYVSLRERMPHLFGGRP